MAVLLFLNYYKVWGESILHTEYFKYMKYVLVVLFIVSFVCIIINNKKAVYYLMGILVTVELVSYPMVQSIVRVDKGVAFTEPKYISALKEEQENEYDRVYALSGLLIGNLSAIYGIQNISGVSPTPEIHYWNFMNDLVLNHNLDLQMVTTATSMYDSSCRAYLNLLGVKYILIDNNQTIEPENMQIVYSNNGVTIYKNLDAFERAFTVHNVINVMTEQEALEQLKNSIDLSDVAIVEDATNIQGYIEESQESDEICIKEYKANSVSVFCNMKSNGLLILSDLYYDGWEVYIDGEKQQIIRTDDILRGVYLEKGQHDVVFKYRPKPLIIGSIVSLCSIIVFFISIIMIKSKEKN